MLYLGVLLPIYIYILFFIQEITLCIFNLFLYLLVCVQVLNTFCKSYVVLFLMRILIQVILFPLLKLLSTFLISFTRSWIKYALSNVVRFVAFLSFCFYVFFLPSFLISSQAGVFDNIWTRWKDFTCCCKSLLELYCLI